MLCAVKEIMGSQSNTSKLHLNAKLPLSNIFSLSTPIRRWVSDYHYDISFLAILFLIGREEHVQPALNISIA